MSSQQRVADAPPQRPVVLPNETDMKKALLQIYIVASTCGMVAGGESSGSSSTDRLASAPTNSAAQRAEVSILARQLGDADPRVRFTAAEALSKMGPHCTAALPELIEHIDDEEWAHFENPRRGGEVRAMVDRAICQISEGVVPRLITCLDSPKPSRRRNAALLLGSRKVPVAIKPLIALLSDADRLVRARTSEALGNLGEPEAASAVATALTDSDSFVRSRAAYALGNMKSVEVVPHLIVALDDRDDGVRQYAALSLGILGDPRAADVLSTVATSDKSKDVRAAAEDAIRKIRNMKNGQNIRVHGSLAPRRGSAP